MKALTKTERALLAAGVAGAIGAALGGSLSAVIAAAVAVLIVLGVPLAEELATDSMLDLADAVHVMGITMRRWFLLITCAVVFDLGRAYQARGAAWETFEPVFWGAVFTFLVAFPVLVVGFRRARKMAGNRALFLKGR